MYEKIPLNSENVHKCMFLLLQILNQRQMEKRLVFVPNNKEGTVHEIEREG